MSFCRNLTIYTNGYAKAGDPNCCTKTDRYAYAYTSAHNRNH
jgi:hypothetical protein